MSIFEGLSGSSAAFLGVTQNTLQCVFVSMPAGVKVRLADVF